MASLKDRIVVLTGASRGIGAATARYLAEDAPTLILCAQTVEALAQTKSAAEERGATVETHGFDVTDRSAARGLIDHVVERFGRVDVLINNAGAINRGTVGDLSPEDFSLVHEVNVMGAYNMIHAALPSMLERRSGTIINLTSIRANVPAKYLAAICSSKAALLSMTQCLHYDVEGQGIRVFAFSPGLTDTDAVRELYSGQAFGHAGYLHSDAQPPERPARVLAWLASEAPADLAGQHTQIQFNDITRRAGLELLK